MTMISFRNRSCQSFFNSPIVFAQSAIESAWTNTKFVCPLSDGLGLSFKGNELISSGVTRLLRIGSPATIFWRVWPVVVNPVKRVFRGWSWPHAFVEDFKRLLPSITHSNSTTTVPIETTAIGIKATLLHISPYTVLSRKVHAVSSAYGSGGFSLQTPAAFGVSPDKVLRLNNDFVSTIAKTIPIGTTRFAMRERDDQESIKAQSRIVFHGYIVPQIMPNYNNSLGTGVT